MAGIFEEVQMREDIFANNPEELQKRYAQTQELVDLLSLQRVSNLQQAAKNQITTAMQTNPDTRVKQLEQEVLSGARSEVLAELAPGIRQKGQRSMQRRAMMGQQPMRQPMQGMAGMPATNMNRMADGGIVGYAQGGKSNDAPPSNPSLLQKVRQGVGQGMMDMGSNMQESDQIIRDAMPFIQQMLGKGPALTEQERAELKAEVEKDPGLIGMFGKQLEKLGIYVQGMAGGGIVSLATGGTFPDLSGDGKVTRKDILIGSGVIDKKEGGVIGYEKGGMAGIGKAYIDPETGEAIPVMDRFKMGLAGLVDLFRSDASNDARRFNMDMVEAVADRDLDAIQFGRTSDDARDFNMDVIEALTERDIGGEEEIEEETMETMSVPTRAEAFASMFPNAQQGVDDYARDKELGGIGSLRTAGRMQEQRQEKDQAVMDFFSDIGRKQDQARKEEARRAAEFILMQGRSNDMLNELDPAISLSGIEEVGIEGFAPGGIVGFDGTNGSSVEMSNSKPEKRLFGDDLGDAIEAGVLGAGEFIGDTFFDADDKLGSAANIALAIASLNPAVRGLSLAGKGLGALGKRFGPRALELAKKAVTRPVKAGKKGDKPMFRIDPKTNKPVQVREFSPTRAGVIGAGTVKAADFLSSGDDTDAIVAEEIIRTAPTSQQKLDSIVDLPRVGRKEAPKKLGLFDNIDTNLLREFLTNAGGQTSTSGALTAGGKGVAKELARQQTRGDKVTSDMARNAVLQQQVEATLGAQSGRTRLAILEAFDSYKQPMNKARRDKDIANILGVEVKKLSKQPAELIKQAELRADRDFLEQLQSLAGSPIGNAVSNDPELASIVSQYTT